MPTRSPVPAELLAGPFRLRDATAAGVSAEVLGGARFRRVLHGVYVPAQLEDHLALRARAAALVLPAEAVFSHHTAAQLRELPVRPAQELHATVPASRNLPRRRGLTVHQAAGYVAATERSGVAVTSPARTFHDLSGFLGLVDQVILGDAMVRRGLTTPARLLDSVRTSRGRWVRRGRQAAELVRAGADSPPETQLRLLLVFAGLPEPEVNRPVYDDAGGWLATPDLRYLRQRIAIEYDGDHHRTDRRQWRRDVRARENLLHEGWRVIVCTADDLTRFSWQAVARVSAALATRAPTA